MHISNLAQSPLPNQTAFFRKPEVTGLRFGALNPPELTQEDRDYIPTNDRKLGTVLAQLKILGPAVQGLHMVLPQLDVRANHFHASSVLKRKNEELMTAMGVTTRFELPLPQELRPFAKTPFILSGVYLPPALDLTQAYNVSTNTQPAVVKTKPTVIFTLGAAGDLEEPRPFIERLSQLGYPVVVYQPALLDENNKHVGHYRNVSYSAFQRVLVGDVAYLASQLDKGLPIDYKGQPVKASYDDQIWIGHSMGAIATLFALAEHQKNPLNKPVKAVAAISPPESFASAAQHYAELNQSVHQGLLAKATRVIPDKRAYGAFKGFMDTNKIAWADPGNMPDRPPLTPIVVVGALKDALVQRDPEQVFERLSEFYKGDVAYVHVRNATHSSVVNKVGYHNKEDKRQPNPYPDDSEEQPYVRLADAIDDFVANPQSMTLQRESQRERKEKYQGVVRFSGLA